MRLTPVLLTLLALGLACGSGSEPLPPTLDGVSTEADAALELVDRAAALEGALDADLAPVGLAPDLSSPPDGFALAFDAEEVGALDAEVPAGPPPPAVTYGNVRQGIALAALADAATASIVGPPAAAIAITLQGQVTQHAQNVWVATNTVSDGNRSVTGRWAVAWVGVGWLAEMRISTSDGALQDQRWFSGFLSADHHLGWWDFYDGAGALVGVVEWVTDGEGSGEFGIAALSGDAAGDSLRYWLSPEEALIAYVDASLGEEAYVYVGPDRAGELMAPNYNDGQAACWDGEAAEAPFADVPCAD